MSTKPDTETGWSKEYPSLAYGSWFWLRHTPDAEPELHQLTGGRTWMESFGIVRDTTEFLGPVTASDFEQLIQLRQIAQDALQFRILMNGPCEHEEFMVKLCTQCEIREALTSKGEQSREKKSQ